jgi:hypothetical protein
VLARRISGRCGLGQRGGFEAVGQNGFDAAVAVRADD